MVDRSDIFVYLERISYAEVEQILYAEVGGSWISDQWPHEFFERELDVFYEALYDATKEGMYPRLQGGVAAESSSWD